MFSSSKGFCFMSNFLRHSALKQFVLYVSISCTRGLYVPFSLSFVAGKLPYLLVYLSKSFQRIFLPTRKSLKALTKVCLYELHHYRAWDSNRFPILPWSIEAIWLIGQLTPLSLSLLTNKTHSFSLSPSSHFKLSVLFQKLPQILWRLLLCSPPFIMEQKCSCYS